MSPLVKCLQDLISSFSDLFSVHCRLLKVKFVFTVSGLLLMGNVWVCVIKLNFSFLQAKNDPFKKEPSKKEVEDKASSSKSSDKRSSTGIKLTNKWVRKKN